VKKDRVFKFEEDELNCFSHLKAKLMEAPVLAIYDHKDKVE